LKLEASSLSPEEDTRVKALTQEISNAIIGQYSRYFPESRQKEIGSTTPRVLVISPESFDRFGRQWTGQKSRAHPPWVTGAHYRMGRIIVLKDPKMSWDLFPESTRKELTKEFGSEERARQVAADITLKDNLAHELIHWYQNQAVPEAFTELAGRYYQYKVLSTLGYPMHLRKGRKGESSSTIVWCADTVMPYIALLSADR
jgi:hypothetical protein